MFRKSERMRLETSDMRHNIDCQTYRLHWIKSKVINATVSYR